MLVTGSSDQGNIEATELAAAWPGRLYATAGVHPHNAADQSAAQAFDLSSRQNKPAPTAGDISTGRNS
jgi:TatD DNase family protein